MFSSGCAKIDEICARKEPCPMPPVQAGTQPHSYPPCCRTLLTKLSTDGSHLWQTLTLVKEFSCDLHEPFWFWEHPSEYSSVSGGWSASHQNDPRQGHVLLWGHPSCSKHGSQLSSRDQEVLVYHDRITIWWPFLSRSMCAQPLLHLLNFQPWSSSQRKQGWTPEEHLSLQYRWKDLSGHWLSSFLLKQSLTSTKSTSV